jgi:hypothetical protein
MTSSSESTGLEFISIGGPGATTYEVVEAGRVIGTVGRFSLGAGQFGSSWLATTPDGARSTKLRSRAAAAAWLTEQSPT